MRHSVNIIGSASIKGQKIQLSQSKSLNFQQGQTIKIQQNNKFLYAIYNENISDYSDNKFNTNNIINKASLNHQYLILNQIHLGLANITKCNISQKSRQIQIQLSQRDYQIINNKLQIIQNKFLDQVQIIWPRAKIILFYDQHNFVTLYPKINKLSKVDPYAAISFNIKQNDFNLNNKKELEEEDQQQKQFEVRELVLSKLRNNQYIKFGYENRIYVHKQNFQYIKSFLKLTINDNKILAYFQPLVSFTKAPTFQDYLAYKKMQQNEQEISIKTVILQIRSMQNLQIQSLNKQMNKIPSTQSIDFQCSQLCKLSCGLSQKLEFFFLCQQNYNTFLCKIKQSITFEMFINLLKQKKYQIIIEKLVINSQNQIRGLKDEINQLKAQFSQKFIEQIYKQNQFIFFQNYYPFFLNDNLIGLRLKQNGKKSEQSNKNFIMIKSSLEENQINFEEYKQKNKNKIQQMQKILQQSIKINIQAFKDSITQNNQINIFKKWLPLIKIKLQKPTNNSGVNNNNKSFQNINQTIFKQIFQTCYKKQLQQSLQYLKSLNLIKGNGNILFSTYSANGKTYLYNYFEDITIAQSPYSYRSWYLDIKLLNKQSNRYEQIKEYLQNFIAICPYKYIFFDNIDSFLPNIQQSDQMRQKQKIISNVFSKFLQQNLNRNQKIGIFTAKSDTAINQRFKFDKIIKMKNPNRQIRSIIVQNLMKNNLIQFDQNFSKQFLAKTQSISLGAFSYYLTNKEIPQNNKSKTIKNDFSKIVGLKQAKKTIKSVIQKPNKFGFIYQKVKIKVPRGILLYGATGNGKTALGLAAEDQFNMKFFSIKGSDILSKYIGGSQAAVRQIFQKALSVSPSIIFFDQFESIVPRRNSSGTGVTDRVVNQFLCYLDGVSSTTGVFIIAASSRPDLIDPALLRPGRIDSHVYLDYPNQQQRQQLLEMFSKSVKIEQTDEKIVKMTENYSYSDIIGLLKQLRIKNSSLVLKNEKNPTPQQFKTISSQLFYQAIQNFRKATQDLQQKNQKDLYLRFKQGKGQDIKKQKLIQM